MGAAQWIGPYEVLGRLGEGGMGVVFSVRRPEYPRPMALKLLPRGRASEKMVTRFLREGRVLAKIDHPNVVAVLDGGEAQQGWYLVTEQVPGQSLEERIAERGPLEPGRATQIARELTDALSAVHALGVTHRDLKPENVILRPDGTPVLIDFGIVKDPSQQTLTATGALVGTLAFMAPEQAGGANREVDPRTDVYGLGALLFACLSGEPPFSGESALDVARQIVNDEVEFPAGLPPTLADVIRKAMAKEKDDRYATMSDRAGALDRSLDRSLAEGPARSLAPWLGLLGGASAALVALAMAGVLWSRRAVEPGAGGSSAGAALDTDAGPAKPGHAKPDPDTGPAAVAPAPRGFPPEAAGFQRTARARLRWLGGSYVGRLPRVIGEVVGLSKHGLILAQPGGGPWLLDAKTGRLARRLEGYNMAVSANEEFIVTARGKTLTRYALATGAETTMQLEHQVGRLALSDDGSQLLVSISLPKGGGTALQLHAFGSPAPRGAVHLGKRANLSELGFTGVRGAPYAIYEARYFEWNAELEEVFQTESQPSVLSVKLLPDERFLLSDRVGGTYVQARGSTKIERLDALRGVRDVRGARAVVVEKEHVRVVDLASGDTLAEWEPSGYAASFLGDDAVVFGGSCLQVMDLADLRPRWDLGEGHRSRVEHLTWTPSGRVRSLDKAGVLLEWTEAGTESGRVFHPPLATSAAATTLAGEWVGVSEADAVRFYRWGGGESLGEALTEVPFLVEREGEVRKRVLYPFVAPGGELAVMTSHARKDLEVVLRDLRAGADLGTIPLDWQPHAQAYRPGDPPLLALGGDKGRVEVYDLSTKQRVSVQQVERTMVKSLRFVPGEPPGLVVGTRELTWLDPLGRAPKRVLVDQKYYARVRVSPDERWLLIHTSFGDGDARLFSLPDLEEVDRLDLSSALDHVTAAGFSPDSTQLAVGTARGTVLCFELVAGKSQ